MDQQEKAEQGPAIKPLVTDAPSDKTQKGKKSVGREILEWVVTLGVAVILALAIRTFIFEPIRVDGRSMIETLQNNEYMIVTKYDYLFGDPDRFDVVICHYPNRKENFVKRVVGLPGDTIEVRNGTLYVNGEAQDEPYITYLPNYNYGPTVVSEGQYFVLGDNRASSNDSHIIGTLSRRQIVGHVRLVLFPFNVIRTIH